MKKATLIILGLSLVVVSLALANTPKTTLVLTPTPMPVIVSASPTPPPVITPWPQNPEQLKPGSKELRRWWCRNAPVASYPEQLKECIDAWK